MSTARVYNAAQAFLRKQYPDEFKRFLKEAKEVLPFRGNPNSNSATVSHYNRCYNFATRELIRIHTEEYDNKVKELSPYNKRNQAKLRVEIAVYKDNYTAVIHSRSNKVLLRSDNFEEALNFIRELYEKSN